MRAPRAGRVAEPAGLVCVRAPGEPRGVGRRPETRQPVNPGAFWAPTPPGPRKTGGGAGGLEGQLSLSQGTFNLEGGAVGRVSLNKPPLPNCQWQVGPLPAGAGPKGQAQGPWG